MKVINWDNIRKMKPDDVSCLVIKGNQTYQSSEKGVLPLMRWLQEDVCFFKDATVIDKVIGKAAALLLVFGGVKIVYTFLISDIAYEFLLEKKVQVHYMNRVPYIINRSQTGGCPMEQRTLEINDPVIAYEKLKEVIKL